MNSWSPETYLVLAVALAAVPILIGVGTCYLKFSIVLTLMKSGFGTQQAPSAALVMALSIVMSLVVMNPVLTDTIKKFEGASLADLSKITVGGLVTRGVDMLGPWREFLLKHSGKRELLVFSRLARGGTWPTAEVAVQNTNPLPGPLVLPEHQVSSDDVDLTLLPLPTVLGAFVVSEIKQGFIMAFFLLIPFFVIDLIVANVLVGMGLTMMSPVIVSLPVKLLLFITSDGWLLMAKGLIRAYS